MASDRVREYATGPGFFKVEQDRAIALVDDAVLANEIDADARAEAARRTRRRSSSDRARRSPTADRWQVEQRIRHAENQLESRRGCLGVHSGSIRSGACPGDARPRPRADDGAVDGRSGATSPLWSPASRTQGSISCGRMLRWRYYFRRCSGGRGLETGALTRFLDTNAYPRAEGRFATRSWAGRSTSATWRRRAAAVTFLSVCACEGHGGDPAIWPRACSSLLSTAGCRAGRPGGALLAREEQGGSRPREALESPRGSEARGLVRVRRCARALWWRRGRPVDGIGIDSTPRTWPTCGGLSEAASGRCGGRQFAAR